MPKSSVITNHSNNKQIPNATSLVTGNSIYHCHTQIKRFFFLVKKDLIQKKSEALKFEAFQNKPSPDERR